MSDVFRSACISSEVSILRVFTNSGPFEIEKVGNGTTSECNERKHRACPFEAESTIPDRKGRSSVLPHGDRDPIAAYI
jgi:hypothetical protein